MVLVGLLNSEENKYGKPRGLLGSPISGAPGYRAALFLGREVLLTSLGLFVC